MLNNVSRLFQQVISNTEYCLNNRSTEQLIALSSVVRTLLVLYYWIPIRYKIFTKSLKHLCLFPSMRLNGTTIFFPSTNLLFLRRRNCLLGNECTNISEPNNKECDTLKEDVDEKIVLSMNKIIPSTQEKKHRRNHL